jgi:DNA-binding response OmpR family regulator
MSDQKTILLIDDDIDLQQLIKITLKSRGYQVETANNGFEGLEKLQTLKPCLIVLDMNMPKMGGLEFYQKICEGGLHPKYPILVLTARANMEKLFKDLNIDGFMAKPFEVDDLLKEVDTIIKKCSGSQTGSGAEVKPSYKVCLAEGVEGTFNKIGLAFLNAGYTVNPARSGTEAIERICADVPNVALISLGLRDIPGDLVILRLKRMAKTSHVQCVLYTEKNAEKTVVAEKIARKEGIDHFAIYSDAQQLVDVVSDLISVKNKTTATKE